MKNKTAKNALLTTAFLVATSLAANDTFVGASMGYTNTDIDQTNHAGAIILGNKLQESGYNFAFEAGYNYCENVAFVVAYQRVIHDDTYLNNYILEAEYKLQKLEDFTPYVGAQVGYSQLTWDKKPINTVNNDYDSSSYLVGAVAGITYPLADSLELNVNYNLQYMDHSTHLISGTAVSELTHDYSHNLNVGFRYAF